MLMIDHGVVRNSRVLWQPEPGIAHGPLHVIHAIVVHQTNSSTAKQTLNAYDAAAKAGDGKGAHFLIDKDGTIYQTARLDEKCWHVGKLRNRCLELHTCDKTEKAYYDGLWLDDKGKHVSPAVHQHRLIFEGSRHESKKVYPDRWPENEDSVGIEIVSKYLGKDDDDKGPWEPPTDKQQGSLQWLVKELLETLHLLQSDIYRHPQASRKKDFEAWDAKPYPSYKP